jgi:hypothetical protein
MYDGGQCLLDWVITDLEMRIKVHARGEKVYTSGNKGALVERFEDIILAWKESGRNTMYKHVFELARESTDLPIVWREFDGKRSLRG